MWEPFSCNSGKTEKIWNDPALYIQPNSTRLKKMVHTIAFYLFLETYETVSIDEQNCLIVFHGGYFGVLLVDFLMYRSLYWKHIQHECMKITMGLLKYSKSCLCMPASVHVCLSPIAPNTTNWRIKIWWAKRPLNIGYFRIPISFQFGIISGIYYRFEVVGLFVYCGRLKPAGSSFVQLVYVFVCWS